MPKAQRSFGLPRHQADLVSGYSELDFLEVSRKWPF